MNHDLGGFGVPENLYPISSGANILHSVKVENPVKSMLGRAIEPDSDDNESPIVNYSVEVLGDQLDVEFDCKWYMDDHEKASDEDKKIHNVIIKSRPELNAGDNLGAHNMTEDPSITDSEQVKRLKETDWAHGGRKGRVSENNEKGKSEGEGPYWDDYANSESEEDNKIVLNERSNDTEPGVEKITWGKERNSAAKVGKKRIAKLFYSIFENLKNLTEANPENLKGINLKKMISSTLTEELIERYGEEGELLNRLVG